MTKYLTIISYSNLGTSRTRHNHKSSMYKDYYPTTKYSANLHIRHTCFIVSFRMLFLFNNVLRLQYVLK